MTLTPSSIRQDLKCGKGAISKGEKCHVGPASASTGPKEGAFPTGKAIAAGLTAGAIGAALLHKGSRKAILNAPANSRRVAQRAITEVVHRTTAKPPTMRLTPKAFEQIKPPSKTERLHIAAKTANQEAERAIGKAAEAEVERAVAVGNAMLKAGKATRASIRSGSRRHRLTVEKLRRRYEPGYRSPDKTNQSRGFGRGDSASGHQFFSPHYLDPAAPRGDGPSTDYYRSHPKARAKKVRHQAAINRRPEEKDRRVSLTRERRRRGIDGKGGPDVSHTESGGTVLEDPAKNRARNGAGGKARLKSDSTWVAGFDAEDSRGDAGKVLGLIKIDAPEGDKGKPCGASHIAKGYKCGKGAARSLSLTAAKVAIGATLVIGAALYAKYRWKNSHSKELSQAIKLAPHKNKTLLDELTKTTVGSGAAGDVYLSADGDSVFKRLRFPDGVFTPEQQKASFLREVEAHLKAQQAGVSVPRIEAYDADNNLIKMNRLKDYAPLKEQMQADKLTASQKESAYVQLADSFVKLQKAGIAHQDVHSLNVLMNSNGDVKIIDFGQARISGNRLERGLKNDWQPFLSNLAKINPEKTEQLQRIAELSRKDRTAALALLEERRSDALTPAALPRRGSSKTDVWAAGFDAEDGKKYTKTVTNPETGRKNKVRYGAKGYTIAPGTDKGDRYCARSFGDMKSHGKDCSGPDRNTPLCLSRAKWKCSGKSTRRGDALTPGKSSAW